MAAWHGAEDMLPAPRLPPRSADGGSRDQLASHRDDLLTEENAEQADQRDHRRSRRPDAEQAIDDSDHQAGSERKQGRLHGRLPPTCGSSPTGSRTWETPSGLR